MQGRELLDAYLNGEELLAEQAEVLSGWVCADPEHAALVAELTHLNARMTEITRSFAVGPLVGGEDEEPTAEQIFAELIQQERHYQQMVRASDLRVASPEPRREQVEDAMGEASPRVLVIPKLAVWGALAAAVMLLVWGAYVLTKPDRVTLRMASVEPSERIPEPVAQVPPVEGVVHRWSVLRDSHQARWGGAGVPQEGGSIGDELLELREGLARFEMADGTTVLVEGPARLQMDGPGRVRLMSGQLTADVPPSGHGFTVVAPNAQIVDHGTSFGVSVGAARNTLAQVFEGRIEVTPTANGIATSQPIPLTVNQAGEVSPTGYTFSLLDPQKNTFVRQKTFEGLTGRAGDMAYVAAVREMWERDPELIAAHAFVPGGLRDTYGMQVEVDKGRWAVFEQSLVPSAVSGEAKSLGGRLVVDTDEDTTLFFELDLAPGSGADRAGLIREDDRVLGRDGTRICLSWMMALESGQTVEADAWCGLSLFSSGNNRDLHEYMFFGSPAGSLGWGISTHRSGPTAPAFSPARAQNIKQSQIQPGQAICWLVVIDFKAGADHVAMYLDPDRKALGQPDLVIDDVDLRLDRLRFEAVKGGLRWSLDELRLGTSVRSVLQD